MQINAKRTHKCVYTYNHTHAMCEILTFRNLSLTNPINGVVNLPSFLMQSSNYNLLEIDKKHENNTAVLRNRCVAVKLSTGRWR